MKKQHWFSLLIAAALTVISPVGAMTTKTLEGRMQGYQCVVHGHVCPVDSLDPHLMLEPDFVLVAEKGEYWLMPNIDRVVKAKYVHQPIRVTGILSDRYNSVDVVLLEVEEDGRFVTVWSQEMMEKALERTIERYFGVEH